MLGKVIKQIKLEKANYRALSTQNEELKNIIVKIGVDTNDKSVLQKLLQSAESEISVLKKLKLPNGEHPMETEVAKVENKNESILQKLLQKEEDISKLKESVINLQSQIESHSCTIVMSSGTDDPTVILSQLITELNMAEIDLKETQSDFDTTMKIMQEKEGELNKYKSYCQTTYDEIKNLKEKLKGNITLI